MNANYYMGDDNRDELTDPEPEQKCQQCGAGESEPCTPECQCWICRARAARRSDAQQDKGAA